MSKKNNINEHINNFLKKISRFFKNVFYKTNKKDYYLLEDKTNEKITEENSIKEETASVTMSKEEREKLIEEYTNDLLNEYIDEDYEIVEYDYEADENFYKANSKEKAFKVYSDVKNNLRTIESLSTIELIQVNVLFNEELKLRSKK